MLGRGVRVRMRIEQGRCFEVLLRHLRLASFSGFGDPDDDAFERLVAAVQADLLDGQCAGTLAVPYELMQFGRCPFEQADVADRLIGDVQALADGGKRHAMNVAQLCDGSGQIKRRRLLAVVAEITVDHHFGAVDRLGVTDDDRNLSDVLARFNRLAGREEAVLPFVYELLWWEARRADVRIEDAGCAGIESHSSQGGAIRRASAVGECLHRTLGLGCVH